jgi:hypothetical protein
LKIKHAFTFNELDLVAILTFVRRTEVHWSLHLSFDGPHVHSLCAASLRVQEVRFHEDFDAATKERINRALVGSGLIVA